MLCLVKCVQPDLAAPEVTKHVVKRTIRQIFEPNWGKTHFTRHNQRDGTLLRASLFYFSKVTEIPVPCLGYQIGEQDMPSRTTKLSATRASLVGSLLLVLAAVPAAANMVFTAELDGQQVVPPGASAASGEATLVLNAAQTEIAYTIELSPLEGSELSARFYLGRAGARGTSWFELPLGEAKSGIWPVTEFEVSELLAERVYVLISTDTSPAGEIRGDLRMHSVARDQATWGELKAIFSQSGGS